MIAIDRPISMSTRLQGIKPGGVSISLLRQSSKYPDI